MDDGYTWHVEVNDVHERPRVVGIRTGRGLVRVATPPGEGFTLTPDQCDVLHASLKAAGDRARGQRP
jgi:hypothetical protein